MKQSDKVILDEIAAHKKRIAELEEQLKQNTKAEDLHMEFDEFCGKWIEFNGYENGSTLIFMKEVKRTAKGTLGFDGVRITLGNENCDFMGIVIQETWGGKLFEFDTLPYWDECLSEEDTDDDVARLRANLTKGKDLVSELSLEILEKTLASHLYWTLNHGCDLPQESLPFKKFDYFEK